MNSPTSRFPRVRIGRLAGLILACIASHCASPPPRVIMNALISDSEIRFASDTLRAQEPADSLEVDQPPVILRQALPVYPSFALSHGIEGDVDVKAWVTSTGTVRRARIVSSTNEIFNKAALRALLSYQFTPAQRGGARIDVWVFVPVRFRITNKVDDLDARKQMLPPGRP